MLSMRSAQTTRLWQCELFTQRPLLVFPVALFPNTDRSFISLIPMSNETADASVIHNGAPMPASRERQVHKRKTSWPWLAAFREAVTPRSRSTPITSVSARDESVTGAEVLVAYAIRNNVEGVQDAIETVADSRDLLEKGN